MTVSAFFAVQQTLNGKKVNNLNLIISNHVPRRASRFYAGTVSISSVVEQTLEMRKKTERGCTNNIKLPF